ILIDVLYIFFFSSRRRHTRSKRDWSSDVCSSDLISFQVISQQLLACFLTKHPPPPQLSTVSYSLCYIISLSKVLAKVFLIVFKRSEERRVGKECSSMRSIEYEKKIIIRIIRSNT